MTGCAFCRIVAGELPAHVVLRDDTCMAFLDNRPASAGHTLVTPLAHVETLWDADSELASAVMRTTHATAVLLRERLGPDGITVRQNNGRASGQEVPHLHLHLVPRWHGDGHIGWPAPPEPTPDPVEILARLGHRGQ